MPFPFSVLTNPESRLAVPPCTTLYQALKGDRTWAPVIEMMEEVDPSRGGQISVREMSEWVLESMRLAALNEVEWKTRIEPESTEDERSRQSASG